MSIIKYLLKGTFKHNLNLLKTIYVNFRYLPFNQAIKMPITLYGKVRFRIKNGGKFNIASPIETGMFAFGRSVFYATTPSHSKESTFFIDGGIL